ncbi:MAG: ABC transporter permease [Stackebrandtia sp.]
MSAVETAEPGAASASQGSARLLRSELRLIVTRRRNIAGLALMCAVPVLVAVTLYVTQSTSGPPFFSVLLGNGLFVVLATFTIELVMLLPLAVCVVSGDSVAGEANIGTLRYLLTVPVGRARLLAVKFAALAIVTVMAVAAVAATAAAAGLIFFGAGEMTTMSGTAIGFAESAWRVGLVCVYVAATLLAVCAIGLFASTMTEQPIGAAVSVVIWTVADRILGSLDVLSWLHPYLLTTHWYAWGDLLRDPIVWDGVAAGLASAAVYTAVFVSAAWARFTTKDVTS